MHKFSHFYFEKPDFSEFSIVGLSPLSHGLGRVGN